MIAILKLIATLLIGAAGSMLGSEAHNGSPQLARRLIRSAAKWYPENQRQDFTDENLDFVRNYTADGMKLAALMVGINEWLSAALSLGLPA